MKQNQGFFFSTTKYSTINDLIIPVNELGYFLQEILSNYEILRKEFPNAKIKGSTFEEYFAEVNKIRDSLPVIRQEVGDTWIQGIASDPYKMANYRAVSEAITECIMAGT